MNVATASSQNIDYPESDGKPMAETDTHRKILSRSIDALQLAFPEAYVSGNLCLYYVEGDRYTYLSPDVLLALQGAPGEKRVYRTWIDPPVDLVAEISSLGTRQEDYQHKKDLYESELKIPYYVIYDPHRPRLDVFQLVGGEYISILPNGKKHYPLKGLGLCVREELGVGLRFLDKNQNLLLTSEEQNIHKSERIKEVTQRAEEADQRAEEANQRAEEEAQRAEEEAQRAEEEAQRAEEASKRAKEEAQRAEKANQRAKEADQRTKEAQQEFQKAQQKIDQRVEEAELQGEMKNLEKLFQLGVLQQDQYEALLQPLKQKLL